MTGTGGWPPPLQLGGHRLAGAAVVCDAGVSPPSGVSYGAWLALTPDGRVCAGVWRSRLCRDVHSAELRGPVALVQHDPAVVYTDRRGLLDDVAGPLVWVPRTWAPVRFVDRLGRRTRGMTAWTVAHQLDGWVRAGTPPIAAVLADLRAGR